MPECDGSADFSSFLPYFAAEGLVIVEHFLPAALNQALLQEAAQTAGYRPAAVGRQQQQQHNLDIRRDQTRWLDGQTAAQQAYLALMQLLQQAINRQFFLGLFDFECHFARYQPGDYYQKHLDAFKGRSNRVLTTVSYLNDNSTGGELCIYDEQDQLLKTVSPAAGSLVLFESERFAHEVLPAQQDRYSIAGWFRCNNSLNGLIDPSR